MKKFHSGKNDGNLRRKRKETLRCLTVVLCQILLCWGVCSLVRAEGTTHTASTETELYDELATPDSWNNLEITNDIPSLTLHTGGIFTLNGLNMTSTSAYVITGGSGVKSLSYVGSGNENGRLFDYANMKGETVIVRLEFKDAQLLCDASSVNSAVGAGSRIYDFENQAGTFIEECRFTNNMAGIMANGSVPGVVAGGGLYVSAGDASPEGTSARLSNTIFTGNSAIIIGTETSTVGYGGGMVVDGISDIAIEGTAEYGFFGNQVIAETQKVYGGGLVVSGSDHEATSVLVSGITFSGNLAVTNDSGAYGGGVYIQKKAADFGEIRFIDTSFVSNIASSGVAYTAYGGAIVADSDIIIESRHQNVLFSDNRAMSGAYSGYGQSVFSTADVTYIAGAGTIIEDVDGIHVRGTVFKEGPGVLRFCGTDTHMMGNLVVNEGVLESTIFHCGSSIVSSFLANRSVGGSGEITFGPNAAWRLDTSSLSRSDLDELITHGVTVGSNGFPSVEDAKAALDRGTEQVFVEFIPANLAQGKDAMIFASLRDKPDISDIRNSSVLMHRWNTIRNATADRMNPCDYACPPEPCEGDPWYRNGGHYANGFARSAWANYVGRYYSFDSTYYDDDIDISSQGIQTGIDLFSNRKNLLGFMFGYERQRSKLRYDRIDADDYYFGLYGMHMCDNGFDLRGIFGYGFQDYAMNRYSDTLIPALNQSWYDGETFEASLEIGRRFGYHGRWSLRPLIGLDYFHNRVDGADETVSGIHYSAQKLEQLYLRTGAEFRGDYTRRLRLYGGLYYSIQLLEDGDNIDSFIRRGILSGPLYGGDIGNSVLSFSLGTSLALNRYDTLRLYGGYYGDLALDGDDSPVLHTGYVGLMLRY